MLTSVLALFCYSHSLILSLLVTVIKPRIICSLSLTSLYIKMLSKFYLPSAFMGLLLTTTSAGLVAQKRGDICGSKGYDRGKGNYYYSESKKLATYTGCSQQCINDPTCKSFGYSNTECMLFNIALDGNFDADSGSSDTYYDRGCIKSTSSGASTSNSAKTTTSSASKTTLSSTTKTTTPGASATTTTSSKSSSSTTKTTTVPGHSSTPTSGTSTTSSSASASVSVPAGCSVPSPITMTSLTWFNSTHNLVRTYSIHP